MAFATARRAALRLGMGCVAASCAWLLLAAMPVLADGGPHQRDLNSGATTLTSDTCAGCHRAHTAQGEYLIKSGTVEALCLSCHGATGLGATTNVEDGVQYAIANDGTGTGAVAGALRSGGFVNAAIDSAHSSRMSYPFFSQNSPNKDIYGYVTQFSSLVGVLADPQPVTSAHLDLDGTGGVVAHGTAWGNGAAGSGAGPVVTTECTSCHNPHGNGQYRILNFIPAPAGSSFVADASVNPVTDAVVPSGSGAAATRNYTVQNGRTLADVAGTATDGDYWRRYMPWNLVPVWNGIDDPMAPPGAHAGDVPMYVQGSGTNLESFRTQITAWCSACHSRYAAGVTDYKNDSGGNPPSLDPIYTYRHNTVMTECTQCHVAHGSNASMANLSGQIAYPDNSAPTTVVSGPTTTYLNSRLLKIDNRGTCEACHDPTGTLPYDGSVITR